MARLNSMALKHACAWLLPLPFPAMRLTIPVRELCILLVHSSGYRGASTVLPMDRAVTELPDTMRFCDALFHNAEATALFSALETGHILHSQRRRETLLSRAGHLGPES